MDEGATILDVSHCGAAVTDAGIESLASRGALHRIVAADLTACDGVTPRGLRALAAAAPSMHTLRCGGSQAANAAANAAVAPREEVLPGVLPRLRPDTARDNHETWEDLAFDAGSRGAASLRWLVWPDVDPIRRSRVHVRCPRVRVVAPPPEVYAAALDAGVAAPSFVAVDGDGWVGYGAAGTAPVPNANPTGVPTRARTVGRGEDNDGLVVVATGTSANAFGAATIASSSPWWAPRQPGAPPRSRRRSRRTRPFRSTNRSSRASIRARGGTKPEGDEAEAEAGSEARPSAEAEAEAGSEARQSARRRGGRRASLAISLRRG